MFWWNELIPDPQIFHCVNSFKGIKIESIILNLKDCGNGFPLSAVSRSLSILMIIVIQLWNIIQ